MPLGISTCYFIALRKRGKKQRKRGKDGDILEFGHGLYFFSEDKRGWLD